jgi:hypothetical protein
MSLKLKRKIFISTKTELTNGDNSKSNISFNFSKIIKNAIENEKELNDYFEVFLADPNKREEASKDYWEICKNNILTSDFLFIVLLDKKATVVRNIDFFPKPTNFMEEEIKKFIEPNKWKDQNKKTFKVNERIISIISTNISDKDINNFTPTLKLILKKYNRLAPAYDSNITNKKREAENQNQIISNIFAKLRKFISINKKIKDDNSKSSNHSNNSNDGANIDELAMEFQNKYLMNANEDNKTALIKSQFQLLISQQSNLFQKQNILDREELVKILEAFGNTTLIDLSNDSSPNNRTKPLENFISNYQALDDLVKRVDDIPVKEGLNLFKEDLEEYSNAFMGVKQHLEAKPLRKNNSHNNEDLIEELIEHFSENQYSQADNSQIGFKFKKYNLFVKDRITKLIKLIKSFEKYEAIKTIDVHFKYFFKFQLPFVSAQLSKKIVKTFNLKSEENSDSIQNHKNDKKHLYNPKKNKVLKDIYTWIGESLKLQDNQVLNKLGVFYAIAKKNKRLVKVVYLRDWSKK